MRRVQMNIIVINKIGPKQTRAFKHAPPERKPCDSGAAWGLSRRGPASVAMHMHVERSTQSLSVQVCVAALLVRPSAVRPARMWRGLQIPPPVGAHQVHAYADCAGQRGTERTMCTRGRRCGRRARPRHTAVAHWQASAWDPGCGACVRDGTCSPLSVLASRLLPGARLHHAPVHWAHIMEHVGSR